MAKRLRRSTESSDSTKIRGERMAGATPTTPTSPAVSDSGYGEGRVATGTEMAERWADFMADHLRQFLPPFADRFEAALDLYSLSERLLKEQHDDASLAPEAADDLLYGTLLRSVKTYRAVLYLAALGHGSTSLMLDRSLVEDALTAHWIAQNPDVAVEQFALHAQHTEHLFAETLATRNLDLGSLADLTPLTEGELSEMDRLFRPYGTRSWTGLNGHALAAAVKERWGSPNEQYLLDHVVSIHLRYLNLMLHNTSTSHVRAQIVDDGTAVYEAAESADDTAAALLPAFWAFSHTSRAVLRGQRSDELLSFYQLHMPLFFRP